MNNTLIALLTKYRPVSKEYQKSALSVSHGMVNTLADTKKRVEAGELTREMGIKTLRSQAGHALARMNAQVTDMNNLAANIHGLVINNNTHNATDLVEGTKEMLDIAQEVALEMTTTMRTIRANWEDYEATLKDWVKDIQKGLR